MNNNTHPIELLIVGLLYMAEGICWIINEIAGHHQVAQRPGLKAQPEPIKPHVQPLHEELTDLTVKELRKLTGVRGSRYRKADLVLLAAAF